jgi:imidazolonepropionase-like amidohydrolase
VVDAGFTAVSVGHSGIDGDSHSATRFRKGGPAAHRRVGPQIAPCGGRPAGQTASAALVDQEFLAVVRPADGRRAVLENLRVGADTIKVVADDWPRVIDEDTLKAVVDEAHRVGVRVAAHATTALGIQTAIAAGVDSLEHGDEATDDQFRAMRDRTSSSIRRCGPATCCRSAGRCALRPDVDTLIGA